MSKKVLAFGLDLGTTNSVASAIINGKPVVIPNSEGNQTTPSAVIVDKKNGDVVGDTALRQRATNENFVSAVKRLIGRRFDEDANELKKQVSYEIARGKVGNIVIKIPSNGNKPITPEEISSRVIRKMADSVKDYLGYDVKEVVVTVPAHFDDSQRQATKNACEIAGLNAIRIINEPTAAALDYISSLKERGMQDVEQKIVVYDLGGGTFDVSIMEASQDVCQVLSTDGDTKLGGEDFDQTIVELILKEFADKNNGFDLSSDKMAMQRIKEAAEKAKKELTSATTTEISLTYIAAINNESKHFSYQLSRAKLESMCEDLIARTLKPCESALKNAQLEKKDIDAVVLVGGMTRMPAVKKFVHKVFGKEPWKGQNPDHSVAIGAALNAHSIKQGSDDGDNSLLLLDVTSLSVGIETLGGVMTKIIQKNQTIPTKGSQIFSTAADGQTEVTVKVYQGERNFAKDNNYLGQLTLSGIPPAARGVPQIEVTFDIDADGIIHVSATDKGTEKTQKCSIQNKGTLSKEEIEAMVKEAEKNKETDEARKGLVDVQNEADSAIYLAEKSLKEHGDKVDSSVKDAINAKIAALKSAIQDSSSKENKEDIESVTKDIEGLSGELRTEIMKIGQAAYANSSSSDANSSSGSNSSSSSDDKSSEGVVDGEYKEK